MKLTADLREAVAELADELYERYPGMTKAKAQELLVGTLSSQCVRVELLEQADCLHAHDEADAA